MQKIGERWIELFELSGVFNLGNTERFQDYLESIDYFA